jgi:riboflavin biosynthesis pyrimidine reductase
LTTSPRTPTGPTAETRAGSSARESWPCRRVRGSTCGIVNANVADIYDELLAAAGERNLRIVGGGNVALQIADEGLLDEVLVTVVPVVLGVGSPSSTVDFPRRRRGSPYCGGSGTSSARLG